MIESGEEVGFEPALSVAAVMAAFPRPWAVAGGWAIDLWLGRVTREHADIEIAIFRDDQRALQDYLYLSHWTFRRVLPDSGGTTEPWYRGEWIEPPAHQVRAESEDGGGAEIDFLLNERRGRQWVYRRDAGVTRPVEMAIRRAAFNVPVLAPEIVLLYKGNAPRPQDGLDLRVALDGLDDDARRWLSQSLWKAHPKSAFLRMMQEVRTDG